MRRIKHLWILLIFSSCGKIEGIDLDFLKQKPKDANFQFATSNPYFDSYKSQFSQNHYIETGRSIDVSRIRINFVENIETGTSTVGLCYSWGSKREIVIRQSFWNGVSESYRKALIFHELGHCALNRSHKDEKYLGNPVSIMNSYIISGNYFDSYKNALLNELHTNDTREILNNLH